MLPRPLHTINTTIFQWSHGIKTEQLNKKDVNFSDLVTVTSIQRLERTSLAGVVEYILVIQTFQLSEHPLLPTSSDKRVPTVLTTFG